MNQYMTIGYDPQKEHRQKILQGSPWEVKNLLPFEIKLYAKTHELQDYILTMSPQSNKNILYTQTGKELSSEYSIHVVATFDGKDYEILEPAKLMDDSRIVILGDVSYEEKDTPRRDIHHDILSIRFHNHILLPINIFYQNKKIGRVGGNDGTTFMSGSKNAVMLDNDRFGFKLGEYVTFKFEYKNMPYCSVQLKDNYISDVHIGKITQKYSPNIDDVFAYRVNENNVRGLKYFEQDYGYTSRLI